ncbi:PWI domain-containing protein [Phaeosphaeriaceae sp. SRC1lsM3a]|nr:PWI domain-containing protein [Stagonospora sp. SRC1lsM3a]
MALSIDQKRLKATKFPPEFDKKVDIEKVNIDLMKKWIANKITTILGDEDDIVVETCYNLIEQNQFPKIKEIQIQLTGFLNKDTPAFCKELWDLMISAQDSPVGVPRELLEAKKRELQKEQISKAAAEQRRREGQEQNDMIDSFRRSEREERPERPERSERGRRGGFRGDDRRVDDGPHHPAVSEIFTSQVAAQVVAEVVVATDLVSDVALHQAVVPHLHHLVALDAHPLQIAHDPRPGAEPEDRLHMVVPCLRRPAVHDALPLLTRGLQSRVERKGLGLQVMTAEDCHETPRDPLLQNQRKRQAHHLPGCRDHDRGRHHAGGEDPQAAHEVLCGNVDADLLRRMPIRMAPEQKFESASVPLV